MDLLTRWSGRGLRLQAVVAGATTMATMSMGGVLAGACLPGLLLLVLPRLVVMALRVLRSLLWTM